ncbi:uncharacterized protein KZ484_019996 isoform 1-T1 [Pholidichthys leucotaenia]
MKEQQEPKPPRVKEEEEELFISLEGEQPVVKLKAETFVVTPICEENGQSEAESNSEQVLSHNSTPTAIQDEEGNRHVDSKSIKEEEEERKPKKRRLKISHSTSDNDSLTSKTFCENETESLLTSHGCATPEHPDSPASDYEEYECVPPTQPRGKKRNSISDIASVMTQVHKDEIRLQERLQERQERMQERQERQHLERHEQLERHHEQQNIYNNQYLQHLHEVAANTRVAQEQDAAFRREELTETATFNQSFLAQFGRLVDALSGRRV